MLNMQDVARALSTVCSMTLGKGAHFTWSKEARALVILQLLFV